MDIGTLNIPTNIQQYPYHILVIGIFFGVLVFMLALSWNNSITTTIEYVAGREQNANKYSWKQLTLTWIYTVLLTLFVLIMLYFLQSQVPEDFLAS